ncbi:MAG: hypothetical protein Q4G47_00875, partial [Lachnospiraceae bacterium]|nr:hypothetical protein [Lachnospiraceae bacterium]
MNAKKLMAGLLVSCLLMSPATAFADDTSTASAAESTAPKAVEMSWEDIKSDDSYEELIDEGNFETFDTIGVMMWIPDSLDKVELTEDDTKAGFVGYFENVDEKRAVGVTLSKVDSKTTKSLSKLLAGIKGVSDVGSAKVNGFPAVTYKMNERDTTVISFLTEQGRCMEFAFSPASNEDFATLIRVMMASIQNAPRDEEASSSAS